MRLPTTLWTSRRLASSKDLTTSSKSSSVAVMAYSTSTIFFNVFFSIWRAIDSLPDTPTGTLHHETPWRATNMSGELVLVTGGSGFVGAHCILKLLEAGYR